MNRTDYSFYWTDPGYALLCGESGGFLIVEEGAVHVIEDDELCHEIILEMLDRGRKIYDTVRDFQKKTATGEDRYQEYRKNYLKWWRRYSNRVMVDIVKPSDVFSCAWLIHRYDSSFQMGDIKKQLLRNGFSFWAEGCDDLGKREKLMHLVNALLHEGADVKLFRLGKQMQTDGITMI